jgi:anthranilate/para-aminobenzoate synthase component II
MAKVPSTNEPGNKREQIKKKEPTKPQKKTGKAIRTLILNSGSRYIDKVQKHIDDEVRKSKISNHELERITPEQFYQAMRENPGKMAEYIRGFDYIVSSGSPHQRKYDTAIHKFIADNKDARSVFLGICHGAQQYAIAHGAKLKKTDYMHRGQREARVSKKHHKNPVLKGTVSEGKMNNYAHHQYYIPLSEAGDLEVIAEAKSHATGEKFVEMYKVRGQENYGVQFHPEKGNGEIIKNLFRQAISKKVKDKYLEFRY